MVAKSDRGVEWTQERKDETESIMKQWDTMAGYMRAGKHGSLPSDWFYGIAEELVELRALVGDHNG